MKAAVYNSYGPPEVVQIQEVEKPLPKDNEVQVKVLSTTITAADWRARSLKMPRGFGLLGRLIFGIAKPRQPVLGIELAGEVEAIGKKVSRFKIGDAVFANTDIAMGCHAQYRCLPENGAIALKPANLSYEEAAAMTFGGTTALHFLTKAGLASGKKILINGASGAVGTAAVQLAKYFGAEVTAVCSGGNADLVRSLGADHVIDYHKEDFTTNGESYDVIMDNAGTASYSRSKQSLKKGGTFLLVLGSLGDMLQIPWISLTGSHKIIGGGARVSAKDLHLLAELAEAGKYEPFIDRVYPFEEIVEAHRYVDTGHKRGNVVVTIGQHEQQC